MSTTRLAIREIRRPHPVALVSPDDFLTQPVGEISPDELKTSPRFAPYCFDFANASVLFVETHDPSAVDAAPFYYAAQVEHAVSLVSMPFDVFHRVAEEIPAPPEGLTFILSIGRCGSTVLSKALAAAPDVHSISEPDDITQLTHMKSSLPSEEIRRLLRSSVRWRGKARTGLPFTQLTLKLRAEALPLVEDIATVFPSARYLFLYRDPVGWVQSVIRNWPPEHQIFDPQTNEGMKKAWGQVAPFLLEPPWQSRDMNSIEIVAAGWMAYVESYFRLQDADVRLAAVRFEDLLEVSISTLERVFAFCEIENADWPAIQDVLARDAQAGTIYDREGRKQWGRELTLELAEDVRQIVAERLGLGATEKFILPGTLGHAPGNL